MSDQEREYKQGREYKEGREYKQGKDASTEGDEPEVELHMKAGRLANEDDSADTDTDDFELHRKNEQN